jgi:hypothetical protein
MGASINSLDFVSGTDGYAAVGASVVATTDGGRLWRTVYAPAPPRPGAIPPITSVRQVAFSSPSAGFALVWSTMQGIQSSFMDLLRTTDGGRSWTGVASNQARVVPVGNGVMWADDWASAGLQVSRDGGVSWVQEPAVADLWLRTVQFAYGGPESGSLRVASVPFGPGGYALTTTDGGQTWLRVPSTGGAQSTPPLNSAQRFVLPPSLVCDQSDGKGPAVWLVCKNQRSGATVLLYSGDNGAHWRALSTTSATLLAVSMTSATDGWVVVERAKGGTRGRLYRTTNGGRTWTEMWPTIVPTPVSVGPAVR